MSGRRRKKMLSVLFTICMIWFVGKFFIFLVNTEIVDEYLENFRDEL